MEPTNNLNFDCDWQFGFNLDPRRKGTVGYLMHWSGCGGLNLSKDIKVWNPFSGQGQTQHSGPLVSCIGLLESFRFEGGEEDPIRMVAYLSKDMAANVRAKLGRPLPSTKVKVRWYIVSYDEDRKTWYEAAFVKGGAMANANVDTAKGRVQMFIANEGVPASPQFDIRVYKFEFQIVPAVGATTNLEFASGPTLKRIVQWGPG